MLLGVFVMAIEFLWIGEVIRRHPKDLAELCNSDDAVAKGVIVAIWLVTLLMMIHLGLFVWSFIKPILGYF